MSESSSVRKSSRCHIWLRAETKPLEQRTSLTPTAAAELVRSGYRVTVEDSPQNAFPISQYSEAGCQLAASGTWQTTAPPEAIILGLKELPESDQPLTHRHIHFAHVFKNQNGWQQVLERFNAGGGSLYDLEFLVDENGRRVAAFGRWAGFAGAAIATLAWAGQQSGAKPVLGELTPRTSESELIDDVCQSLARLERTPSAVVIGALGRSGQGACELFEAVGIEVTAWDLEETKIGGPFEPVLDFDLMVNCVFVQSAIPPFVTKQLVERESRRLSVICDVSCDPYSDYNPLPIYDRCTSFDQPTLRVIDGPVPLDLVAIDHLPSLLPIQSSEDFATQLLPSLLQLDRLVDGVWQRASEVFQEKSQLAKQKV